MQTRENGRSVFFKGSRIYKLLPIGWLNQIPYPCRDEVVPGSCTVRLEEYLSQVRECWLCSPPVEQKEAIRNIFVLKKDTLIILPTSFGKSLIFQLLPLDFDSWLGPTESIVYFDHNYMAPSKSNIANRPIIY